MIDTHTQELLRYAQRQQDARHHSGQHQRKVDAVITALRGRGFDAQRTPQGIVITTQAKAAT
jgi:response regulator of citrate/malate metabolism